MRGATRSISCIAQYGKVSIHAPHAGRDEAVYPILPIRIVSIHAPHAGRDAGF